LFSLFEKLGGGSPIILACTATTAGFFFLIKGGQAIGTVFPAMCLAMEKHLDAKELAELWGISPTMVRSIFRDEPGVLLIGEPSGRVGRKLKRSYMTMRIPLSVVERVHLRRSTRNRSR
jgi:hypothetical protein